MHNLIRMDLYRMWKGLGFKVCLGLTLLLGLCQAPLARLMSMLSTAFGEGEAVPFLAEIPLSGILMDPFPVMAAMLAMLSVCFFFGADQENGYIKNIAGQMPMRGFTVASKYLASIAHNLLFAAAGLAGALLGNLVFRRVVVDGAVMEGLRILLMKLLLLQGVTAILLLVTVSLRSKSLGIVLSVLLGTGMMVLVYQGLEAALHQLPMLKDFTFTSYMPDQLLENPLPGTVESLISTAVCVAVFLPLAIRVFDRRDVK